MTDAITTFIFEYSDPSVIILEKAADRNSSELLKNRLVSKTLKQHSDRLIELLWQDLRQANPRGAVNVVQAMKLIDKEYAVVDASVILKFAMLMGIFKKQGCLLAELAPVHVMVNDFRKLQEDLELQKMWRKIRDAFPAIDDLPGIDAKSETIRPFLHNNKNILETFIVLNLNNLDLNLLPPELKLFTALQKLTLKNNQLNDVSSLAELKNLTLLWLENNQLKDVSCLATLKNLTHLCLSCNQLTDVSWLAELKNLTHLWLNTNQLTNVSFLAELKNLTALGLENNQLTDVSCLAALENLIYLSLRNNQLTNLSFLKILTQLIELDIRGNPLNDYSFLISLKNLKKIVLNEEFFGRLNKLPSITETPLTAPINLTPVQSLKALHFDQELSPILDTYNPRNFEILKKC